MYIHVPYLPPHTILPHTCTHLSHPPPPPLSPQYHQVELERDQAKQLVDTLQQQHSAESQTIEHSYASRLQAVEESYQKRAARWKEEQQEESVRHATKLQQAEKEKFGAVNALKRQLESLEMAHASEVDRMRETHQSALEDVRREHELTVQQLRKRHHQEVETLKSAHSHTRYVCRPVNGDMYVCTCTVYTVCIQHASTFMYGQFTWLAVCQGYRWIRGVYRGVLYRLFLKSTEPFLLPKEPSLRLYTWHCTYPPWKVHHYGALWHRLACITFCVTRLSMHLPYCAVQSKLTPSPTLHHPLASPHVTSSPVHPS